MKVGETTTASSVRRRVLLAIFGVGSIAIAAAFLFPLIGPMVEDRWHRRDFDPAAWQANVASESPLWPARLTMVDDLLAGHELVGQSQYAVEQLLGPGDDTAYHRSWDLVYWLGPERGLFRIDSEWLVLRLDDRRTVTEVSIVRD